MTNKLTPEQIAELRALCEAATDGPWESVAWNDGDPTDETPVVATEDGKPVIASVWYDGAWTLCREADASFIAAANPATVLSLLDHLDKMNKDPVTVLDRVMSFAAEPLDCGHPVDCIPDHTYEQSEEPWVTCRWCVDKKRIEELEAQAVRTVRTGRKEDMTYEWIDGMGEISGMGGNYEQGCRNMVKVGCEWLEANPDATPRFSGVYGILGDDNAAAAKLSEAVMSAPDPTKPGMTMGESGATPAMHQATVTACLFVKANGWDAYVAEMSKKADND